MNKPRVTTFKQMSKKMKKLKKQGGGVKKSNKQQQDDFDRRFEDMKGADFWGYGYTYDL